MFQPSQNDVRRFFCAAYRRQRAGEPLTPMDALAATWYGYRTLWVNRTGAPFEELGTLPTRTGDSLLDVFDFFAPASVPG